MIAYLRKSEGSEGFHQIIDFLNDSHIQYALIENPTIYVSFIKQFWSTTTARTSATREVELTVTIDGQEKTITEASLRRHLKLEDNGGVTTLPNSEIFEQLALMGQQPLGNFNFLKFIFDAHARLSTSQPSNIYTIPVTEEDAFMPHESPLQRVHSLGHDEGSLSLHEMTVQCTNFSKQTYGTALTKLIKKVKKLEQTVKTSQSRRRTRVVLSDEEEVSEDPSKQGRSLIEELDLDAEIYLVPPHDAEIQEKIRSGEKGEQEVNTALNTASVPISTANATPEVSTATANLVYIIRSAEKRKDKGKVIMIEDESVQKKLMRKKEKGLQEMLKLQEEYDKARKKEDVAKVDTAHAIYWNDPFVIRYHALQNGPRSIAEVRKNMLMYLKNQGGYKMKDFKGMSYDDIRPIFEKVWDQVHSFVPMDSKEEVQRLKRAGQDVEAKPAKRQRTKEVSESVQEQTDEEPKTDELS
ncbi:hypothetical protein Tco_0662134 [Tanacetum coccineum]